MTDPATFGVIPQQHLGHRQREQLAIGQQRLTAPPRSGPGDVIVDQHVKSGQEGVQFFRHTLILNTLLPPLRARPTSRDLHGINHLVVTTVRLGIACGSGTSSMTSRLRCCAGSLRG